MSPRFLSAFAVLLSLLSLSLIWTNTGPWFLRDLCANLGVANAVLAFVASRRRQDRGTPDGDTQ